MKVTLKGWVHAVSRQPWEAKDAPIRFILFAGRVEGDSYYIPICEAETTVQIPDGWSMESAQITALHAAKAEALRQYQRKVEEINERLAKLTALTNDTVTVSVAPSTIERAYSGPMPPTRGMEA